MHALRFIVGSLCLSSASAGLCNFNQCDPDAAWANCKSCDFKPNGDCQSSSQSTQGRAVIVQSENSSCPYVAATDCGGTVSLETLSRIEMDIEVAPRSCSNNQWMAVYMYHKDKWMRALEPDFLETNVRVNPGGPISNWAGVRSSSSHPASWGGKTHDGIKKHLTFGLTRFANSGGFAMRMSHCAHGSLTCPESRGHDATYKVNPDE